MSSITSSVDRPRSMQGRLPGILVVVGLFVAACTASAPSSEPSGPSPSVAGSASSTPASPTDPTDQMTRTSDGGQVTAVVAWPGPAVGIVFDVKLDTHSVDLDGLDLADAIVRNDRGQQLPARPWAALSGGHHRAGSLAFDGDAAVFLAEASWIELVLIGVGEIPERAFRWQVSP